MRLLLTLPLLALVVSCAAQDHYLDSLWHVYRTAELDEEERLFVLHEIVDETRYGNTDSAQVLAGEFMRRAQALGKPGITALAHRDLGAIAEARRDNARALEEFAKAIELYATTNDSTAQRGMAASLHNMGIIHKNMGQLDSAMALYRRSMDMDRRIGNDNGLMYCYGSIGRLYEIRGENDSALVYYARSGSIAERLGEKRMVAASLGNRANVYERMGQPGPAIDHAYRCLSLMEELGNDRGVATALTTVASLRSSLGENEAALRLLQRSHALYGKVGYLQGVMTSGKRIGMVLLTLGRPDSAVVMLEKAVTLEREFEAKDLMSETLNSLARAYQLTQRHADARTVLKESLMIARDLKDGTSECAALALLGRTELAEGRAAEAIRLCSEGLRIAERAKVLAERGENCRCLYLAYKAQGNGLQAVHFLEAYDAVQDSLASEKIARDLTQRDLLHTFGKQQLADSLRHVAEQERIKTEADQRAAITRNRYQLAGAAALVILVAILSYFISDRRRRRARFEKEAAQLETQALRSQMNPHFIFNALNSINAFVQRNDRDSAAAYLSKFARLMRLVLENSRQAEVPLKDDLEALDLYLNLERTRSRDADGAEKFDYSIVVDPDIDQEDTLVPPLVVQPFVENAIWHGMAGKEGRGHIALHVARNGNDLVMSIEDDGAGRHAKKPTPPTAHTHDPKAGGAPVKKTSLGTTITKARLDLVSKQRGRPAGFSYIDLPQGTRVEVRLPLHM